METRGMMTTVAAVLAIGVGAGAQERWPGTLHFRNVTATNIVQTVPETSDNEKEVEFGDFDKDGDLDVVIANAISDFGPKRNKLYRNDGGVFREVSGAPIISGFSVQDVTRNAFFRDYDLDGWLDIIVVNDRNNTGESGRTKIYMNQHPGGVFTHFTEEGNTRLGAGTGGAACGGVSIDADEDGDFDLYVGNYPFSPQDTLYLNDGHGFFTSVTGTHVPVEGDYTVDVAAGDMNGDGNLDLLICNHSPNWIYYNNLNNAGSGTGDFHYTNSAQNMGNPGQSENAMEPGDFNNDGRMDIYHSNSFGPADRILENTGNDLMGRATFMPRALPPYVTATVSRKATVADLNHDGRQDVVVMMLSTRPAILRNTTVNGTISFVDWTPGNTFPTGFAHRGWHAATFDANADGWEDLFVGGWTNDHLLHAGLSNQRYESELGGQITGLLNADPIAIRGEVLDEDVFQVVGLPVGATVSAVLHGCSDLSLEVFGGGGSPIASSDRGTLGIEEAVQFSAPGGSFSIRVTKAQPCGDLNNDGDIDAFDFEDYLACATGFGPPGCEVFHLDDDGDVDWADFAEFQEHFTGRGTPATAEYLLEVLARN